MDRTDGDLGSNPIVWSTATVALRVLGPVRLFSGDEEVRLSDQRSHILAVLAAEPGIVVAHEEIERSIWGTAGEAEYLRLRVQVNRLRGALPPGLQVDFERGGYRLLGRPGLLDSAVFERLVIEALAMDPVEALDGYRRALSLWTGAFPFGGVDSVLVSETMWRLCRLRDDTILAAADCELAIRRPGSAIAWLASAVADDPVRSDLTSRYARLLALAGRHLEALDSLAHHRRALQARGAVLPPELADLEGQILRHEFETPSRPLPRPVYLAAESVVERHELVDRVVNAMSAGTAVVVGEAGTGKSQLIDLVRRRLTEVAVDTVAVAVAETPGRPMEALRSIIEQLDAAVLHSASAARSATSEARSRLGLSSSPEGPGYLSRDEFIDEVASILVDLTDGKRTVVIDDAHLLDGVSHEVISRFTQRVPGRCLLASRTTPVIAATVLRVPPFTVAEVREFLVQRTPARASEALAEEVHRWTGGNPLFASFAVGLLVDGEFGRAVPPNVQQAIATRIGQISRPARELLQTASLLGAEFPTRLVGALYPSGEQLIGEAELEGLVAVDGDGNARFVHGVVAECLRSQLPVGLVVDRHDRLCEALIAHHAGAASIAVHAVQAAEFDPVRAAAWCRRAALADSVVFDWVGVQRWATQGRLVIERRVPTNLGLLGQLEWLAGMAMRRSGTKGSDVVLRRAARAAGASGDDDTFIRAVTDLCLHGPAFLIGSVDEDSGDLLEQAISTSSAAELRAPLLAAAAGLYLASDRWARGRALYAEAQLLSERCGQDVQRAVDLGAHLGLAHPDDGAALRTAAVRLRSYGDVEAVWESVFLAFHIALIEADRSALSDAASELRLLTPQVKHRPRDRALLHVESALALVCGRLDDARRYANESYESALGSYSESWAVAIFAALVLPIQQCEGTEHEVRDVVELSLQANPTYLTWHAVMADVANAGDDRRRRDQALDVIDRADARFVEDFTWTAVLTFLARSVWASRHLSLASRLSALLLPHANQMSWNGVSTHGPTDAALALYADVLGDREAVARHHASADRMLERLGAPHLRWRELDQIAADG